MNIYVVDDDENLRETLGNLLEREEDRVQSFANGRAFLSVSNDLAPGCVLLDLCLPDMDGLELQQALVEAGSRHRVVLLTGFGDIPDAVNAMRAGAVDFLRKPFRRAELFEAVDRTRAKISPSPQTPREMEQIERFKELTPRERDVLDASSGGGASKQMAHDLKLSVRTVEMHRSNIVRKLEVPNFVSALLVAQAAAQAKN
ncbi:response regulator transcription factor [Qipengyuania sp. MTN3-11]|uniref:response regulator transcription factor n=1 Tax=Qipengyuania sp. MTN3-11 TaxID=3056557 RepID=UPI0036F1F47A